jgi:hypothetical protein
MTARIGPMDRYALKLCAASDSTRSSARKASA